MSSRRNATMIGCTAILLWSSLAMLSTMTGRVPAIQLTAMAFTLAFVMVLPLWLRSAQRRRELRELPVRVWLNGIGGLFGYHFFYFVALRSAPVVEANLVNYLWPLVLVLMTSLLPGERLRWFHAAGAAVAFLGAAWLVTGGRELQIDVRYTLGYLAALGCAVTWPTYSVLSRVFGHVPTHAVGAFCGATAVLSWLLHVMTEATIWPAGWQWGAVAMLAIGPMGLAFFVWDHGVKRGNLRVIGAFSYFAPLFSTLLLVAAGRAVLTSAVLLACGMIVFGALMASGLWWGRERAGAN